jgi:hypothetical protein
MILGLCATGYASASSLLAVPKSTGIASGTRIFRFDNALAVKRHGRYRQTSADYACPRNPRYDLETTSGSAARNANPPSTSNEVPVM